MPRARQSGHELPVRYRDGQADDEKAAIAQAVAAMVPTGSHVVGLTGGTTTTAVARALASRDEWRPPALAQARRPPYGPAT